jgi:exopolysaccharide biosynthesis polyprenyl glycosylphosphotransferase
MKSYTWNLIRQKQYIVASGDIVAVLGSLFLCIYLTNNYKSLISYVLVASMTILCQLMIFYLYDLYSVYSLMSVRIKLKHIVYASLLMIICSLCIVAGINKFNNNNIEAYRLLRYGIISCVFIIVWRYIVGKYLVKTWKPVRLAIIAPEQILQSIHPDLSNIPLLLVSTPILSSMDDRNRADEHYQNANRRKVNRIADFLRERDFDILAFYSANGFLGKSEIQEMLRLPFEGKQIYDLFGLYGSLTGKVPLRMVDGQWLLKQSEFHSTVTKTYGTIKRLLDVVVSALALAFLAPLMVLIGVVVKGGSRGPMFFAQERLGQNLKTFQCYKFRTMIDGAEDKCGPVWASQNDPRITTIGRFLRKSRLDELPQLWNVLKGDMTLVGPRPIRESYARELEEHIPFYRLRFCVKPGLTGWAQVNYDYAGSIGGQFEKFQYELFYTEHMSLVLDLLILFKTIKTVLRQRGT